MSSIFFYKRVYFQRMLWYLAEDLLSECAVVLSFSEKRIFFQEQFKVLKCSYNLDCAGPRCD